MAVHEGSWEMSKQRSPNYPGFNLEEVLKWIQLIYSREKRTSFTVEIAARALGYTTVSGATRIKIGASRQYGFIEKDGEKIKLSERAIITVIRTPSSRDWKDAVKGAALEPPIFRELHENIEASDDSLKSDLVGTKNFTDDGADRCIKVFRETMLFSGLESFNIKPLNEPHNDDTVSRQKEGVFNKETSSVVIGEVGMSVLEQRPEKNRTRRTCWSPSFPTRRQ